MKRCVILLTSVITILLNLMLAGCGESSAPVPPSPPPNEIVVTITQSPTHLGASETYQFTATVTNASDTKVKWSVSGCTSLTCSISNSGLFTAPPFIPSTVTVTIIATTHADATKTASVSFPLMPISLSVAPNTPLNVVPGGTQSFTATIDHDAMNAGVTWTLSGAGCSGNSCGTLNNVTPTSVVYRAPDTEPELRTETLRATSITDPNQSAVVTITVSSNPFLLSGEYAFLINGYRQGTMEAIAGQFNANGNGALTGVWDVNRGATIEIAQPITGNYNIQSDGHGTMTINSGSISRTYIISVADAGATARFAESTTVPPALAGSSSGYMVKQNANYFTLSSLEGDRVIAVFGEATHSHVAALGRFTSNGAGSLNNGVMDLSWAINQNVGKFANTVALTGTFGPPDAITGRGTASLNVAAAGATATYKFTYYIISDDRLLLVQTDVGGFISGLLIPTLSGEVRYQKNAGSFANASLNLPVVFHVTDATWIVPFKDGPMIRVGRMIPDGLGTLQFTFDQNKGGTISLNMTATGDYSVSADGRVGWNAPESAVAYLVDQNYGYFMSQDADGAGFGAFEPQTDGPFVIGSLTGAFLLNTGPPAMPAVKNAAGWMTLTDNGTATATLYINRGSGASPYSFAGTATVFTNGRGTLVLNPTPASASQEIVFWAISPKSAVAILTVNPDDTVPALLILQRTE